MLKNGEIFFKSGSRLHTQTSKSEFLRIPECRDLAPVVVNLPWMTFSLRKIQIEGQLFAVAVRFKGERLLSISLARENGIDSWDEYSVAAIEAEKVQNDDWLRNAIGVEPGAITSWGKIDSVADAKTGSAAIVLTCA